MFSSVLCNSALCALELLLARAQVAHRAVLAVQRGEHEPPEAAGDHRDQQLAVAGRHRQKRARAVGDHRERAEHGVTCCKRIVCDRR